MGFFKQFRLGLLLSATVVCSLAGVAVGGDTFKSKKMPDGKVWMTENLNIKTGNSWCYDKDESNCKKYGRLYDWTAATKACPSGWRLPSDQEWIDLAKAAGGTGNLGNGGTAGTKLKSKTGWNADGNGTDDFGFSALPGGHGCFDEDGLFDGDGIGSIGIWWSIPGDGDAGVAGMHMSYDSANTYVDYARSCGCSVRCVRNGAPAR